MSLVSKVAYKIMLLLGNIFYFSLPFQVGHMIQAESDPQKRDEYLQRLMDLPNQVGDIIIHSILVPPLQKKNAQFLPVLEQSRQR